MSNKAQAAIARPVVDETPLQQFERELQRRHPDRMIVRFDFPSKVREARAIYIKEIASSDDLEAAKIADATMTDLERSSFKLSTEAQRKESMRVAIVGVVRRTEPIRYEHVGGAVPFVEMDSWSVKAMTCVRIFYGQVNGISDEEILEGLKGQRTIGGTVAPIDATPPSHSTER